VRKDRIVAVVDESPSGSKSKLKQRMLGPPGGKPKVCHFCIQFFSVIKMHNFIGHEVNMKGPVLRCHLAMLLNYCHNWLENNV